MNSKTDSREKIVAAASKLFQLKGYTATGLNEILRESGAPKGSLYYYFPNGKEELALAAVDLTSKTMQANVLTGLNSDSDPVCAVSKVISDMITALKDDGRLQTMSLSMLALETCQTSDTLREACARSFEKMSSIYAQKLLDSGFSYERSAELGTVLQSMIEGAITLSLTARDVKPLETVLHQLPLLLRRDSGV
jgi:TetR/AcrR family transcriptional repressor of lmrAB and yxaGH operons